MPDFTLKSTAFENGQPIPARHTREGEDISPALAWSDPPPATRSFALLVVDPDAPAGTWTHWILTGIPATARSLPDGVDKDPLPRAIAGASNGINGFGDPGWGGPMPPPGKPHRYYFKLYALDAAIAPGSVKDRGSLLAALKGHILAVAETMGTYQRA